jgi:glycosyltransferase involved in cell wall biosynthesis
MRVVHIITGLNYGGAESALFRLITFNTNDLISHVVVSMTDEGFYCGQLRSKGILVYALDMPRRTVTLRGLLILWKILKETRPDVVQTWMYHSDLIGGIVARLSGIKKIIWGVVHYNLDKDVTPFSTRVVVKLCALFSGVIPDTIISCSEKAIGVHLKIGYKNKFKCIPLGFDVDKFVFDNFSRKQVRNNWGLSDSNVVLGCVARWDPQKDHKNLITAFTAISAQYPGVKCVLVGPKMDQENKELVKLIHKIYGNGNDLLLNGISDNIYSTLNAFDIHILPSLGEAFPNVVAEAMGCGTPCVVTDVGDASIIVDRTGWVVPSANSEALTFAIREALELLKDYSSWKLRKESCRNRILHNYSMEKMIANYHTVWIN